MSSIEVPPESNLNLIFAGQQWKRVVLVPGNYYLTDILTIDWDGLKLLGRGSAQEIHIHQLNENRDGISVKSRGVKIRNISLHVPHSKKVALVVASSHQTTVSNCYFYGNDDNFTVYYAGPGTLEAGLDTLEAYRDHRLDRDNVFSHNVVYTNFSGDAVSFSLQENGVFRQNIVRGGKLAVYMCRNTEVSQNCVYDANSQGLFVSLPSHNLSITKNHFYHCQFAGITVKQQLEHIDPSGELNARSNYEISISQNTIYDNDHIGIEINDGQDILVNDNHFLHNRFRGIYLLNSNRVILKNNVFSYFLVAIELVNITNSQINSNEFYTIHPQVTERALMMLETDDLMNENNCVCNNRFVGKMTEPIHDPNPHDSNIIGQNEHQEYYSYQQERQIMKLFQRYGRNL
jgi:parallel beta-helix repeat protein